MRGLVGAAGVLGMLDEASPVEDKGCRSRFFASTETALFHVGWGWLAIERGGRRCAATFEPAYSG